MKRLFRLLTGVAISFLEREIAGRSRRVEVEKAQALMKIADFHLTRFNKSRDIERYVNFTFWAFIVVVGGFLLEKYPIERLPFLNRPLFYYAFGSALAGGHFAWLCQIQKIQDKDRFSYFKCRDKALEHIGSLEEIGRASVKDLGRSGWSGVIIASLTTLMLWSAVTFLVFAKVEKPLARTDNPPQIIQTELPTYEFSPNLYLGDICPLKLSQAETILGTLVTPVD